MMKVAVIGLGYVGLPLVVSFADAGHEVVGLDVDGSKLAVLRDGRSYIEDVSDETIAGLAGSATWTSDYADLKNCEETRLKMLRMRLPTLAAITARSGRRFTGSGNLR